MLDSSVPSRFWVEALSMAVYLINRLPSLLYILILHILVSLVFLMIIVLCMFLVAFVLFTYLILNILGLLSNLFSVLFLAIVILIKGLCYDMGANKLRISRHVIFLKNQYFFPSCPNHVSSFISLPHFDEVSSTSSRFKPGLVYQRRCPLPLPSSAPPLDPVMQASRRSTRVSRPPNWYDFSSSARQATIDTTSVRKSYSQAPTQECWHQAVQDEFQARQDNHTSDIVPCPTGVKLLGCKRVYTIKFYANGSIKRHKARLVALENQQEYGLD
jgi:hypothetical protein